MVGQARWITSFAHDATTQSLVVGLTSDPETYETDRVLEFREVRSVCDHWIDRDDECMESLLGAHETQRGSDFRYVLMTEQREIEILAGTKGLIHDFQIAAAANPATPNGRPRGLGR